MINLAPLIPGKKPEDTTVVVAMSGGVDSSCVTALLHKLGYKVIGITLQLWDYTPASEGGKKMGTCCALDDVYDARRVCQTLGVPHYVLNYESEFKEKVIDDFVETYLAGATPIPCVRCNQRIKFDAFLDKAKSLGADCLVTGHYVRKERAADGTGVLLRGSDPAKDQSYFLFATTQEQLDYIDFPLGRLTKDVTRELAKELGLHLHAKKDSQDICFVPEGDYRAVVKRFAPEADAPGTLVDTKGNVLGKHDGIINFTIGQRKGLGVALGYPAYVVEIRPDTREVVIGTKDDLGVVTYYTDDLNWIGDTPLEQVDGMEVTIQVRNNHKGALGQITYLGNGRMEVQMYAPEDAVTPGQAAVFYDGERMLGGGWIKVPRKDFASGPVKVNLLPPEQAPRKQETAP
ncbi:MAG: tRNA 2-thiouridine(34) synthase MnmA [Proteobacteria bacterium]|nr:tRNA 2-thiouridine(34) synthase MnmA [Pseudomonadota bacterium]